MVHNLTKKKWGFTGGEARNVVGFRFGGGKLPCHPPRDTRRALSLCCVAGWLLVSAINSHIEAMLSLIVLLAFAM
jgi:hypothetical protein